MKLLILTLLCICLVTPSLSAVICRNGLVAIPFKNMMEILKRKYDEVPTHLGTSGTGSLVLFSNKKGGTMSLIFVNPQGLSCMMSSAKDWDYNPRPDLRGEGL